MCLGSSSQSLFDLCDLLFRIQYLLGYTQLHLKNVVKYIIYYLFVNCKFGYKADLFFKLVR